MREVTMGRARRDAFVEMADRTGVDELRALVNSIVQAEDAEDAVEKALAMLKKRNLKGE